VSYLHDLIVPGLVLPFGGNTSPNGWLLCHGQAVSRNDFAGLFEVVGTTFGIGDGSTTFNVPDLRGRVAAGKDNMGGTAANRLNVSTTGNTTNASATVSGIPSTASLAIGMKVVGAGIPAGATILTIASATSVTISANATATASGVALRFGVVDGATVGDAAGTQGHALTTAQIPSHNHDTYNNANGGIMNNGGTTYVGTSGNFTTIAGTATLASGGGQAHTNVQPTMVLNYLIKT
jgi:microcystin-dependent protein